MYFGLLISFLGNFIIESMRDKGTGYIFTVIGIAFFALGISAQRVFLVIAIAFLVIGLTSILRDRRN